MASRKQTIDGATRAIGVQPEKPRPFEQMGAPGFAVFGGFLQEDEKDHTLTGREKYRTFSNMLANVCIVGAGVRFFLNVVGKCEWKSQPADDTEDAKKLADLVKEIMDDMETPWANVVRRAAMATFYGFAVQEWTAKKREDGVIGYLDVEPRAQVTVEQWDTDPDGNVLGVVQRAPQDSRAIYIPRGKLIHTVDDSLNDSPEGLGLFRHLAKSVRKLERYEILEGWGFETDLRGVPIGRAPLKDLKEAVKAGRLTKEDAEALVRPVKDFVEKHIKSPTLGLLLDSTVQRSTGSDQTPSNNKQFDVELLKGDGGSQAHAEIAQAIERVIRDMARVMGVEHLLLGADSKGSHALAQDKSQSFGMIVDSCLLLVAQTMQRDFLGPLFLMNGWDKKLMPKLVVGKAQFREITEITAALESLAKAGAPLQPDDPATNEVRELLGLTAQKPLEEIDPNLFLLNQQGQLGQQKQDQQNSSDQSSGAPPNG